MNQLGKEASKKIYKTSSALLGIANIGVNKVMSPAKTSIYNKNQLKFTKNEALNVPKEGSIIVFDKTSNNPYGHIAIVDNATTSTFTSLDQNYSQKQRVTLAMP